MAKKGKRRCDTLPILHPDAAGIDVGASELFVAVSADRDPHPVRSFPTFTLDLHALADWLGLSPEKKISESRRVRSRVATALRMGAQSLRHAKDYLGEFFRRIVQKLGKPQAFTATA